MDKRLIFGQIGETSQIIVHKNKKYSKYLKISSIDCIFATGNGFCDIKHIHDMKQIEVVAAIIHDDQGRIFATQRGYGDMKDGWEFPGGKMEPGESPEEALKREIWEELETRIVVERREQTVEWDYPKFHLTMHCFWCSIESGGLTLKEHEAAKWLNKEQLNSVDWLPADRTIIEQIKAIML